MGHGRQALEALYQLRWLALHSSLCDAPDRLTRTRDEGRIDADAKPFARAAIRRQLEDADEERTPLLHEVEEAIEAA